MSAPARNVPECSPAVAGATSGAFAVVWEGTARPTTRGSPAASTRRRRSRGAVVQVNKDKPADQYDAAIAADRSGNYRGRVVQRSTGTTATIMRCKAVQPRGCGARRGHPGQRRPCNAPVPPADLEPAVAATPDGGFVVAWIQLIPASGTSPGHASGGLGPALRQDGRCPRAPDQAEHRARPRHAAGRLRRQLRTRGRGLGLGGRATCRSSRTRRASLLRRLSATNALLGTTIVVAKPMSEDSDAAVSCGSDGSFVVAWHERSGSGGSGLDGYRGAAVRSGGEEGRRRLPRQQRPRGRADARPPCRTTRPGISSWSGGAADDR